ncbi:glyceraldehyde-3-phosphate dehydrogenase-like protein [Rubritalea halochordaticola]|uniref:Glyceraldehyde-3-phosphate dehydrogenase-like protein n=1 Tax=Rubritalea halochordaticola TaxID=714537 RepID=A0ABP9V6G7_9BACT
MTSLLYEQRFSQHLDEHDTSIELTSSINHLARRQSIELVLFRNHILNISPAKLLKLHSENLVHPEVAIHLTAKIAQLIEGLELEPCTIDIGKLAVKWEEEEEGYLDDALAAFLKRELADFAGGPRQNTPPKDVVLYGFGRIGRLLCRELIKQAGNGHQLRLRAVVVRSLDEESLKTRAALLGNDSTHGTFDATITMETRDNTLTINGQRVQFIEADSPDEVNYHQYGISDALVIDNTGAYTTKAELSRHLDAAGVAKVILTAPGEDFNNTVFGVNQDLLDLEKETIFSAASCTTNAISPVLDVMQKKFGIVKGHIESIHAYTNDQNLLDNMHKKHRRGRSAAVNMVITSTRAGTAVAQAIPCLAGKLTSNAVRVPTPNGSLAILNLDLESSVTVEEVNQTIREAAQEGPLANQIKYATEPDLVSTDIIGSDCCSVFDSNATIASPDAKNVVLYIWYDNEHGYTMQVTRLAKYVSHVLRPVY